MATHQSLGLPRAAFHVVFHLLAVILVIICRLPDHVLDMVLGGFAVAVVCTEVYMITSYRSLLHDPTGWYGRSYMRLYQYLFRYLVRPEEQGRWSAMSTYVLGLVTIRFSQVIIDTSMLDALVAMTVLSWGDPAARIGGILLGGPRIPGTAVPGKRWTGAYSFFLMSGIMMALLDVLLLVTGYAPVTGPMLVAQGIAIVCGDVAEVYTSRWDNFWISIAAYTGYMGSLALFG